MKRDANTLCQQGIDPSEGIDDADLIDFESLEYSAATTTPRPATATPKKELPAVGDAAQAVPDIVCLADVHPVETRWLWAGRVPLGKLTIVDGDPGLGKSTVTLDLAARVSRGVSMPDGTTGALGGVLLLSAEDGEADTICPRCSAGGADLSRIRLIRTVPDSEGEQRMFDLSSDLGILEKLIVEFGVLLVVIDPLVAYISGKTDSHKDQDIRRVLGPLSALAERTGCAIVAIRHLNKMSATAAIYRGGGSIAISGAARSVLMVGKDPDDDEKRILASVKSNLGAKPPSMRYQLVSVGSVARVDWLGECEIDADALCTRAAPGEDRSALVEACRWLEEALAGGAQLVSDVQREARLAGITSATLKRAKASLGIRALKSGMAGGWTWALTPPPKELTSSSLEPLEPLREQVC
jgi:hypothetical protein